MEISMNLITGVSLGFEFVEAVPEMDIPRAVIIDILILRFLIEY